ncbi:response regulator [Marinitenerispora sediminis]|uniref:response regulator n=1 Tax=Marinitenerispora sediminis TaxID=1931232 RepID=UPI000DF214E3|nr:response regulator transcription factor [Marinitenerispora sediminis]RCV49429.1 hypothetical protein DEF23_23650 [Marinitenerispora sediminis]
MRSIRILIADDHTLLRNALTELLHMEKDFEVVAVAGDASEAVRRAAEHQPDVVLLDIQMPGNDHPPTTLQRFRRVAPAAQVLVLTMYDDARLAKELLPLGIRGYLHKAVTARALASAVREASSPASTVTLSLSPEMLAATPRRPGSAVRFSRRAPGRRRGRARRAAR